ncbi:NAD(P)H-hydrate dehydratase [Caulobacter sp. KR2-114]|uniref:NAD(P)H-hydrate dehydratase n=1 Tax=Caulobacter sp. KR2-114 TaxID=3400912 RepID=UPI003C0C9889
MAAREILTVAEMTAGDKAAIAAGTPGTQLMERAGRAVTQAILERFSPRRTVVLCGPGNNGGDGYVVARMLAEHGWDVSVQVAAPPKSADAIAAAARWTGPVGLLNAAAANAELVVDAIFGAGLDRPLTAEIQRLARASERWAHKVVAVDTPSGLSGDTGRKVGEECFHAALTVTFHRRKPGHVLQPGLSYCGEVAVADIGLGETPAQLWENTPDLWLARFPWPAVNAHKHARGRMIVVSGEPWSTGAARLAARSGLRVGAGLVTLLSPPEALRVNAAHLEAVMLKPFETELELEAAASDAEAVVIGPAAGVNEATLGNVLGLARTGAALVLDADALTVFRNDPGELFSALDRDDVLTPHVGEFERIFPGMLKAAPERISAARSAARRAQATVLLKGPDTVVASPDGRAAVNLNGTPWLATAGSGDVLAGLIGGLIAQGMESFEAACAGAWIHAQAGAAVGPGLISEDLPGKVPEVLKDLWERGV